ncbi:hypothetical protein DIPPA_13011 [Diplonema papillatum]|nr:hypothetical protein DIPPA_13011 [Diplonema papillatum]
MTESKYFHMTENSMPCMPFVAMRVCRPLPKSPASPSFSTMLRAPSAYEIFSVAVCRYALSTRSESLTVSDTT